ncbi:transposase [Bacillaceae bacterium SAS-127]|nr:transposase [Bacillaceae bacterium SAS-127]
MLPFFTNPYPDELLYSAIARYHFYSGNLDYKDTLEELFDNRSVIPSVEIGSHFSVLAAKLGLHYSNEKLLAKHTIYPYYSSFLDKDRQQEILNDVQELGQALYTRLGTVAGSICRKKGLYYCAECARLDIEKYGDPYIHREHQLQGIDYCPHHELQLKKYPITKDSRIAYIRFEEKYMNFSPLYKVDSYKDISIQLAKQAYKLLQLSLHSLCREEIRLKYRALLRERNLVTASNHVRQEELYRAINSYFPQGFLEKYESSINQEDEYNWLKIITRNTKRHVHPFRHLLLLHFLEQDINDFVEVASDNGPFGSGPYPCLNRAATHYKELMIPSVEVTCDFKSKAPIGTFHCSCGFVYARKGPDTFLSDKYKIGRVKVFGEVWKERLQELLKQNLSTRSIARTLGVDSKTVKKYSKEGIDKQLVENDNQLIVQYKKEFAQGVCKHSSLTRTEIRTKYPKQYAYLYRHDKEWLMATLPANKKRSPAVNHVNWEKRDKEYVVKIKDLHLKLLSLEKPVHITKTLLGKKLNILANLERHLNKLPNTQQLLNDITETVQQFQIRRCYKVIDETMENNAVVLLWKVQKIAAIKSHHFHEIKPILERYIKNKQDVKEDEQTTG